jgi:hypothetical protein
VLVLLAAKALAQPEADLIPDDAARFPAAQLNATERVYPGTNLCLVCKLASH